MEISEKAMDACTRNACLIQGFHLRAEHKANWLAVMMILPALKENFPYETVPLKNVLPSSEKQLSSCWKRW